MRLRNLLEYDDLNQEKEVIISKIAGLQAENDEDAALLDRIYKLLNSGNISQSIGNAFQAPLANEPLSDNEKRLIMQDMTQIISNGDSDYKSMKGMVDQLEKGGVINVSALDSPLTSFSNVFTHPSAVKVFSDLKNYGVGKKQKGPGEYALASLSDKIRLATGEGDLEVDGIGKVELKAAVSSSGGRIGYGGGSQKAKRAVIDKYAERIPTVMSSIGGKGGSLGLGKFIDGLNTDLPTVDRENQQVRQAIASELLKMDLEQFADPVIQAIATTQDVNKIEDEYLKANFAWYKNRDDFDALLLCSFPNQKFAMIKNEQDLLAFKNSGHAQARSISIIPTQAGAGREQWAQLTLNKANV
tara:strand:- start:921 stop:1991 length:1071 start_codon:yes stop_codon:yes gene_type:complete